MNFNEINAGKKLNTRAVGVLKQQLIFHFCLNFGFITSEVVNRMFNTKQNRTLTKMVKDGFLKRAQTGLIYPNQYYYLTKNGAGQSWWYLSDCESIPEPITSVSRISTPTIAHDYYIAYNIGLDCYQERFMEFAYWEDEDSDKPPLNFNDSMMFLDSQMLSIFYNFPKSSRVLKNFGRKGKVFDLIESNYDGNDHAYEYERSEKTRDTLDRFWVGLLSNHSEVETITILGTKKLIQNYVQRLQSYQGLIGVPHTDSRRIKPRFEKIIRSEFLDKLFFMFTDQGFDMSHAQSLECLKCNVKAFELKHLSESIVKTIYRDGKKLDYRIRPSKDQEYNDLYTMMQEEDVNDLPFNQDELMPLIDKSNECVKGDAIFHRNDGKLKQSWRNA